MAEGFWEFALGGQQHRAAVWVVEAGPTAGEKHPFVQLTREGQRVTDDLPLPVAGRDGEWDYSPGTSAGTVTVPEGARLRRVAVIAGSSGATVDIFGKGGILVPGVSGAALGAAFEETIGDGAQAVAGAGALGQVVFGGSVASFCVSWSL